ncbi:hypothetical protein FSP39_001082 [Pinctada imbricata]|uniref:Disease resistance R13L4/SHOC-2-like LRR domain-containing protein n=1 Tax=Pinctada imbricata TaxID=66713 RepID=A0AA88XNA9_PINIB|nr:hypothetical protein FSP39_001082 [Pinctada imbricata]
MAYLYIKPKTDFSDTKNLRLRIETEDPLFYGLKKLKIRGLELSDLPLAVFNLVELEILDMSPEREACLNFRLVRVPKQIGRLINLQVLILDTNELIELPREICLLVNLERLALSNNNLSELPVGFKSLQKLQSLHMANNNFQDFPMEICEIQNLGFLDMSDNGLQNLPEEISNMKELHTLLLFYNRLETIPESICTMTSLHCLWLGNNFIRELPRDFGRLVNLDWDKRYVSSTLDGNPLTRPPLEICRMGPRAIDRYLTSSKSRMDPVRNNSWERNGISEEGEQDEEKEDATEKDW